MLPSEVYLSGYWQSEKYFSTVVPMIRNQFSPKTPLDGVNIALQEKLKSQNSVAVHVRRGDYATTASYNSFFGTLPMKYYEDAIRLMNQKVGDPVFYFFSDDPAWCKATFSTMRAQYIDHNQGEDAYKDLLLMSACSHAIIANSTFSWWGAWLNGNSGKVVIAPKHWFTTNYLTRKEPVYASRLYNTKDLIPESWIRL